MDPVITADRISMHFRRCDALAGVNLEVQPGTVFALLGENGAGKTTLIKILTGFLKPTAGLCNVCGINPTRDPQGVRRQIGYVSDAPALYDWMTVAQIGGFASSFYDRTYLPKFQETISRFEVSGDKKIRDLSRGQRAKVALSLALAHDPDLLIMDEPTSGLDPKVRRSFLESMIDRAATGRTVFLSSHQISEVERVADVVAILHRGKIRLVAPLSDLRDSVHQVVVDLDDPLRALPMFPEPAEVLSEDVEGRQRQFIVRDFRAELAVAIGALPGVIEVRHRAATLEELFVACTSDQPTANQESDSRQLDVPATAEATS